MADEITDKAREELLRQAQEEQERIAAAEEENRLSEEARRQYEETRRELEEHVRITKAAFEDMGKFREEMAKKVSEIEQKKFNEEWERSFTRWTNMASTALREVMQRSMTRSIDATTVGALAPGLGDAGRTMGSMLGTYIGSAFGPMGAMIGKAVGGPIVDMIAMQAEGYNMLGARVARQAYGGGRGVGKDLEQIGQNYREAVQQVVRETGATAEQVGQAFDALSKVNVGFEEGGKDLAQYALSVDRVLNLRPGRTLQMETDLVKKYGESAERSKMITRDLIDAMAHFNVESARTGNALMATYAAGETLANTLEQISSGARSSGASLDALNGMAIMFVQTVAGQGTMRPEQIGESGARVTAGLMPSSQGTMAAEMKRSGIDRLLLGRSNIGKGLMTRIEGEGDAFGMSQLSREQMFNSLGVMHFSKKGEGRAESYRYLAGMLEGLRSETGDDMPKAWSLLQQRGSPFTGTDMFALHQLTEEFDKAGVFTAKDPAKVMRQIIDAKAKDPETAEFAGRLRKFMDEAKRQGDAQASTLDKISDHMTKMSVWFNRGYWVHGRDAIAEAFGLAPKASMLSMLAGGLGLSGKTPERGSVEEGGIIARLGYNPFTKPQGAPAAHASRAPGLQRQELHVSSDTQTALSNEATANRSGLETTGQ